MTKDQESDILVQFLCLFSSNAAAQLQSVEGPTAFLILHCNPPFPAFLYLTICWRALFAAGNLYLLCELIWVCLKYLSTEFSASVVASREDSHEES